MTERLFIDGIKKLIDKYGDYFDNIVFRMETIVKTSVYIKNYKVNNSGQELLNGLYAVAYQGEKKYTVMFDCFDLGKIENALCSFSGVSCSSYAFEDVTISIDDVLSEDVSFESIIDKLLKLANEFKQVNNVISMQVDYQKIFCKYYLITKDGKEKQDSRIFCTYNFIPLLQVKKTMLNLLKNYAYSGSGGDIDFEKVDIIEDVLGAYRNDYLSDYKISSGKYDVILDSESAAFMMHELVGHLLESDLLMNNFAILDKVTIGKRVATDKLTIVDDPTLENLSGSYKFDDEGNEGKKVVLIKKGVINAYMNSMETANYFNHNMNGHARSVCYNIEPAVRMSNTYIHPGNAYFDNIIHGTSRGVYVKSCMYAKTNLDEFTVYPKEAYLIENGKITKQILPPIIRGKVFELLNSIVEIGNDLKFYNMGCTKGYSSAWIPVSVGGVHIKIKDVEISQTIL